MRGPNEGGKNLYYIEYAFQKVGTKVGRSPGFMTLEFKSSIHEFGTLVCSMTSGVSGLRVLPVLPSWQSVAQEGSKRMCRGSRWGAVTELQVLCGREQSDVLHGAQVS